MTLTQIVRNIVTQAAPLAYELGQAFSRLKKDEYYKDQLWEEIKRASRQEDVNALETRMSAQKQLIEDSRSDFKDLKTELVDLLEVALASLKELDSDEENS